VLSALVAYVVLLAALEGARRVAHVTEDVTRKLYLAGIATWSVWAVQAGQSDSAATVYLWVAALAYLSFRFGWLHAIEDDGPSLGSVFLPLSGALLFTWFRSESAYIAAAGMLACGFGDSAAALVGRRTGTRKYRMTSSTRSMEGTLAMFLAGGLVLTPVLAVVGGLGWHQAMAFALITSTVAASIEAVSVYSTDNLTVPIATAATLATLVHFSQ